MSTAGYLVSDPQTEWEVIVPRTNYETGPTTSQLKTAFANAAMIPKSGQYGVKLTATTYVTETHLNFLYSSVSDSVRSATWAVAAPSMGSPYSMGQVLGLPVNLLDARYINAIRQVDPLASPSPGPGRRMEFDDVELMSVPEPKPATDN